MLAELALITRADILILSTTVSITIKSGALTPQHPLLLTCSVSACH